MRNECCCKRQPACSVMDLITLRLKFRVPDLGLGVPGLGSRVIQKIVETCLKGL